MFTSLPELAAALNRRALRIGFAGGAATFRIPEGFVERCRTDPWMRVSPSNDWNDSGSNAPFDRRARNAQQFCDLSDSQVPIHRLAPVE